MKVVLSLKFIHKEVEMKNKRLLQIALIILFCIIFSLSTKADEWMLSFDHPENKGEVVDTLTNVKSKKQNSAKQELEKLLELENKLVDDIPSVGPCLHWAYALPVDSIHIVKKGFKKVEIINLQYFKNVKFESIFTFFSDAYTFIDYRGNIHPSPQESGAMFFFLNKQKEIIQLVFCPEEQLKKDNILIYDEQSKRKNLKYFLRAQKYKLHQFVIDAERYITNEEENLPEDFVEKVKNMLKSK